MYTVLIQSKQTMDCLQQFYPLLSETISAGHIGLCLWVESGSSVEIALPELNDLIKDKRAWKAVVVSTEFGDNDDRFPVDPANPFDFKENQGRSWFSIDREKKQVIDCDAPLIRLTHLLGGIPAPDPEFAPMSIEKPNMVPQVAYVPKDSAETVVQKEAYNNWIRKNKFCGLPPTEIVLVKVRNAATSRDDLTRLKKTWQVRMESDSSHFWKKNLYPNNCRFLVFDMEEHGALRRQGDLFKMWLGILLISKNEIDPDVLQAHRLYSMNVLLNEVVLAESFQQTINKLNMAKFQLEKKIAKDDEKYADVNASVPDYALEVPVSFPLPKVSDMHFDRRTFRIAGGAGSGDLTAWEMYSKNAKKELQALVQSTDRTLDYAANRLRGMSRYTETEVAALTPYQEEDFELSLSAVYEKMIEQQEDLPDKISDEDEKIAEADKQVRDAIVQRMTRRQIVSALAISLSSVLICLLPGLFYSQARLTVGAAVPIAVLLLALISWLVLVSQRNTLIRFAKNYQLVFQGVVGELAHNATSYSAFLSSVASHIHGRSYLNILKKKRYRRDSSYYYNRKHLKEISRFLTKLSTWSIALHVSVDMKSVDAIELIDELASDVDYDSLYSFDVGKDFSVPLNRIGSEIESPFGFIERLEIEREEVYDHATVN